MSDYAAPSGPPPPKVPKGWKAVWNEQYREWFYVNIYTKKSQWDKPTEPIYPQEGEDELPDGPPPYDPSKAQSVGPDKRPLGSNNPFNHSGSSNLNTDSDEELARRLQAEEDARGGSSSNRGEADSYYSGSAGDSTQGGYANPDKDELPPRPQEQKRGLLGKLLGKNKTSSQQQYYDQRPPQQQYYSQGPSPGPGYGGYGPPPGGYYPPPGGPGYGTYGPAYGGYGGYGGGYGPPQRHGLGAGSAAALGVGGGLISGLLIGDAIDGFGNDGAFGGGDGGDMGGGDGGGA